MHIIYNSLTENEKASRCNASKDAATALDVYLRYESYLKTCEKFRTEITAIQKYLPGWTPAFKRP